MIEFIKINCSNGDIHIYPKSYLKGSRINKGLELGTVQIETGVMQGYMQSKTTHEVTRAEFERIAEVLTMHVVTGELPQDPPDVGPVDKWAVSDARVDRTGSWWFQTVGFHPDKVNRIPVAYVRIKGKAVIFSGNGTTTNGRVKVINTGYEGAPVPLGDGEVLMVRADGTQFEDWPVSCRPFLGEGGADVFEVMSENWSQSRNFFLGKMHGKLYVRAKDVEVVS